MSEKKDEKFELDGIAADFFRETFRTSLDNCVEELKLLQHIADRSGFMITNTPLDYSPPQQLFIKTFLSDLKGAIEAEYPEVKDFQDDEKTMDEAACQQKT